MEEVSESQCGLHVVTGVKFELKGHAFDLQGVDQGQGGKVVGHAAYQSLAVGFHHTLDAVLVGLW